MTTQATPNTELMRSARTSLEGNWGIAIGTFLIYQLLVMVVSLIPFIGSIAIYVVAGPMALGIVGFSLNISRGLPVALEQIFDGFKRFEVSVLAYFLTVIFTLLWMLLLIIPGIIASLSYAMTFYIIREDEKITALQAIDKSKKMMYGYKWKLFCMGLVFFLLSLVCILTLGIGFLWLVPFASVCMTKFYEDLKRIELEEFLTADTIS